MVSGSFRAKPERTPSHHQRNPAPTVECISSLLLLLRCAASFPGCAASVRSCAMKHVVPPLLGGPGPTPAAAAWPMGGRPCATAQVWGLLTLRAHEGWWVSSSFDSANQVVSGSFWTKPERTPSHHQRNPAPTAWPSSSLLLLPRCAALFPGCAASVRSCAVQDVAQPVLGQHLL